MSFIGPVVGRTVAGKAAVEVAKKLAVRIAGGIKGAKTVDKVYAEGSAAPIAKSQAEINAEGVANARKAMGLSEKPTPQEIASRTAKENLRLQTPRIKRGN